MPTSEELARQARASREQLSRTIDELRGRLNGPSLVDEMTGFLAQSGGSVLPSRPIAKARYAVPLALIGAGVAWLALEARRREQRRERRHEIEAQAAAERAAVRPPEIDPALEEMRRAAARQSALEPVREHALAPVESVSLAPTSADAENQDQRSLPL